MEDPWNRARSLVPEKLHPQICSRVVFWASRASEDGADSWEARAYPGWEPVMGRPSQPHAGPSTRGEEERAGGGHTAGKLPAVASSSGFLCAP